MNQSNRSRFFFLHTHQVTKCSHRPASVWWVWSVGEVSLPLVWVEQYQCPSCVVKMAENFEIHEYPLKPDKSILCVKFYIDVLIVRTDCGPASWPRPPAFLLLTSCLAGGSRESSELSPTLPSRSTGTTIDYIKVKVQSITATPTHSSVFYELLKCFFFFPQRC